MSARTMFAVGLCWAVLFETTLTTDVPAQTRVNCGLFRNPVDQARCVQANQSASRAYRNERLATYGYYGAKAADLGVGYGVRRVPGGKLVYRAGKSVGNYWATHPQAGRAWAPPPIRYPYPNIQGPPRQFTYRPPPPLEFQRRR